MTHNYTFDKKLEKKIIKAIARFAGLTTAVIIASSIERAIKSVKENLQAAEKRNIKPISAVLIAERSLVNTLYHTQTERALTDDEKRILLMIVQCVYHDGGKIEGITSIDSTCFCEFCNRMRKNPDPRSICAKCYAERDAKFKTGVGPRHALTAFIFSHFEFTVDMLQTLPIATINCRFNEDGDIINELHAINYLKITKAFPHANFGFWFKNLACVAAAVNKIGYNDNVSFIYSDPYINGDDETSAILAKNDFITYSFTVYDKKTVKSAIENGAAICNGRKCINCGYKCYNKTHNARNIAEKER